MRALQQDKVRVAALLGVVLIFATAACSDGILYPVYDQPTDHHRDTVDNDTGSETETQKPPPKDSDTGEPPASDTGEPPASDTGEPPASDTGEPPASDTGEPPASDTDGESDSDNNFCKAPYSCISDGFCLGHSLMPFKCENPHATCCDLAWCNMYEDSVCARPLTDECLGRIVWIGNKCEDEGRICCIPGVSSTGDTLPCTGPNAPFENTCVESPEACKNNGGTPHSAKCDPMKDNGNTCCYHPLN